MMTDQKISNRDDQIVYPPRDSIDFASDSFDDRTITGDMVELEISLYNLMFLIFSIIRTVKVVDKSIFERFAK